MSSGPYYDRASKALDAAHKACFNHPERDVLGMSHGPFSGVNEALEIIAELEEALAAAGADDPPITGASSTSRSKALPMRGKK